MSFYRTHYTWPRHEKSLVMDLLNRIWKWNVPATLSKPALFIKKKQNAVLYFKFSPFKLPKLLWIFVSMNSFVLLNMVNPKLPSTAMSRNSFSQSLRASLIIICIQSLKYHCYDITNLEDFLSSTDTSHKHTAVVLRWSCSPDGQVRGIHNSIPCSCIICQSYGSSTIYTVTQSFG